MGRWSCKARRAGCLAFSFPCGPCVFDRYPKLQVILGHCGEGLPFNLARIDQRMRHMKREFWSAKKMMMKYWTENFSLTTAGVRDEAALLCLVSIIRLRMIWR